MRIYVATKFEEFERAREVMDLLRSAGHTITYDWTRNKQFSRTQARNDKHGVVTADALVCIFEKDLAYKGVWVEFGIAVSRHIPIYVLGTAGDRCIFLQLQEVHRGIEDLVGHLIGLSHPQCSL
jgi:hypothetical protein